MHSAEERKVLATALIRAGINKNIVCKATTITAYQYEKLVKCVGAT